MIDFPWIALMKFLESINMEELFSEFLQQELDLDVLAGSDEKTLENLMDRFNITSYGSRVKFKKACLDLKGLLLIFFFLNTPSQYTLSFLEKLAHQEMENMIMKVETTSPTELTASFRESMERIMETWLVNHNDLKFTKEIGSG